MLNMPADMQMTTSTGWITENLNIPRRMGIFKTKPRKMTAPPVTHQRAEFGARKILPIVLVQDRLVIIRPRLAIIKVVNARVRASSSPCPRKRLTPNTIRHNVCQ